MKRCACLAMGLFALLTGTTCPAAVIYSQNFNAVTFGSGVDYINATALPGVLPQGTSHGQWQFWSETRDSSTGNPIVPSQGLIQVTDQSPNGTPILILHDTDNTHYSLNEVILSLNVQNFTNIVLGFQEYDANDEENSFGVSTFIGHKNADGVAVSSNGTNWFTLADFSNHNGSLLSYSLNISSLIAAVNNPALLSASTVFQIKFQQYDNYFHGTDGRKIDNIVVSGTFNNNNGGNVPEPASLALFGLGLAGMAAYRRRQKPVRQA